MEQRLHAGPMKHVHPSPHPCDLYYEVHPRPYICCDNKRADTCMTWRRSHSLCWTAYNVLDTSSGSGRPFHDFWDTSSESRRVPLDIWLSERRMLDASSEFERPWHESMIHFLNSDERCTTFENVRLWVLDVCDPPSEFRCPLNVHIHTHFIYSVRLPMLQIRGDSSMVELKGTTGQHTPQSPVLLCPVSAWLTMWHTDWVIL